MNETPDIFARVVAELMPAERMRMATVMYATALAVTRAGIRAQFGDLTASEMRQRLLRRLHGAELTGAQITAISRTWAA